jgi:tetratricopeptide (TPR) repeat protein
MISMKFSKTSRSAAAKNMQTPALSIFNCDSTENDGFTSQDLDDDQAETIATVDSTLSVQLQSLSADEHKALGCSLAENGDMREALSHFELGLTLAPTDHFLWDLKSQVLLHFDKFLPAIKAAEEVVRLAPAWSEGYVSLARAQREFGEIEWALGNMQTAQGLDKNNVEYANELTEIEGLVAQLHSARAKYEAEKQHHASCGGGNCRHASQSDSDKSCLVVHQSQDPSTQSNQDS